MNIPMDSLRELERERGRSFETVVDEWLMPALSAVGDDWANVNRVIVRRLGSDDVLAHMLFLLTQRRTLESH